MDLESIALAYFIRPLSSGLDDSFKGSEDAALKWARKVVKESHNPGAHVCGPGWIIQRNKAGSVVKKKSKF